jgi:alkylation response protein AidB-like acyl-CoA dehydrogenase
VKRTLFEDEHEQFRQSIRAFFEKEALPHRDEWERAGIVDRNLFRAAGANGFLAMAAPEKYGGGGVEDFRYNLVIS